METQKIEFIKKNITSINYSNYKLNEEGKNLFHSETNLKDYISKLFFQCLKDKSYKEKLIKRLHAENYVRAKIPEIANDFQILKKDLEKFYDVELMKEVDSKVNLDDYLNIVLNLYKTSNSDDKKFRFCQSKLKKFIGKQKHFISTNGFIQNITNINSGVMTANAGDSAQFLFLARAILAGYNCSNVDVRSSRYDAVIDIENKLLRIQVKGISDNKISFKDRDRGGQGIDSSHERNIGKKINSKDCDIYVAVDKQVGTCYILPVADFIEKLDKETICTANVEQYKENWSIIEEVANLH